MPGHLITERNVEALGRLPNSFIMMMPGVEGINYKETLLKLLGDCFLWSVGGSYDIGG